MSVNAIIMFRYSTRASSHAMVNKNNNQITTTSRILGKNRAFHYLLHARHLTLNNSHNHVTKLGGKATTLGSMIVKCIPT